MKKKIHLQIDGQCSERFILEKIEIKPTKSRMSIEVTEELYKKLSEAAVWISDNTDGCTLFRFPGDDVSVLLYFFGTKKHPFGVISPCGQRKMGPLLNTLIKSCSQPVGPTPHAHSWLCTSTCRNT
jgi:hypothetical protein